MAALKLFQSILGPRGPTSKKPSMAAFKGTQDPLGPRSPTPLKKQMLAHSRGHVRPLGGEGGEGKPDDPAEPYFDIKDGI